MTEPSASSRTRATRGLRTTSPADSASHDAPSAVPARATFVHELEQLKIQIEVMALKVDEALQRSARVLLTGDLELADHVIAGDDEIDSMLVSLTERCYELLGLQAPVASDLRFIVSALRMLSDLERMGDLCLRIVKLAPDQHLLRMNLETFAILRDMAHEASRLLRSAIRAWSSQDLDLARSLEREDDVMDLHYARLLTAIMKLTGPNAVPIAVTTLLAGRALERIADHSVMIGERLRYLLTGEIRALSKEIGP